MGTRERTSGNGVRLGQELVVVHGQLRARVAAKQSALDGDARDAESFRNSCMSFCRALRRHHMGENDGAFQVLRRQEPNLADVLGALVRDHMFLDPPWID